MSRPGRDVAGSAPAAGGAAEQAAALLARDRAARREAQTRFDRPLVLEAGAGTGKTTTLIARLLAWCLGAGWEKAERRPSAPAATMPAAGAGIPVTGGASDAAATRLTVGDEAPAAASEAIVAEASPAAAEATAARVLRRVAALTFTEAAAAEMAERAARELLRLAQGAAPAEWLADAALPPAPTLALRARALLATLDHLAVETIHAYCLRLLAAHPLEAEVHPRLQVDADGRGLQQIVGETVEAALLPGYGAPGDPHLLALAAQGYGPREVAAALAALADAGLPAAVLRQDAFAGGGWRSLRRRLAAACACLEALLAERLAGSRLRNAVGILEGVRALGKAAARGDGEDGAPAGGRGRRQGEGESLGGDVESPDGDPGAPRDSRIAAEVAALQRQAMAVLPPNLHKHLSGWGRGRLNRQEETRLGEVRGALAAAAATLDRLLAHLAALDPPRLRHARLALAPLLATVERELIRRGVATFDSLLRGARRLLAAHPEVRARLRRAIDQLLVDEFQDTDATQCEVLRWIALDGPAEERPGLFLVGDPKQSIYGWRSADLRAYDGFVARVLAAGGEVLPLVENFRSVPAILDEVTRVVAPIMAARPGVQPAFAPLVACAGRRDDAGFTGGGRAPVEHWVSWLPEAAGGGTLDDAGEPRRPEPPPRAGDAAALEAAAVADDLLDLHERRRVPWRDAAILLRGTGDLDTYLDALRRAGIPFAVGRDKQYFRRREVIDAAALVRAVLDPGDHLALITALRSPVVGVPDAALLPLWRRQLPRLLTDLHQPGGAHLEAVRRAVEEAAAELPAGVPGLDRVRGWELSLLAAVEHLAVLRESFASEPADRFVERLRRLLLLDATAAARYLGAYQLANLDRFFRQLLVELDQGSGDAAAVLRALRDSVATGRDAEEGRPPAGGEDAVQVLTIHGAKGLDFAHVYLPQLHKPAGGERPLTAVGRLESATASGMEERYELRLLGAATPGFDLVEERRLEVEAAERVRTLYVAMTRAKDRLVLAGAWPRDPPPPSPPEHARTHLQLLAWRPGTPDLRVLWQEACAGSAAAETDTRDRSAGSRASAPDAAARVAAGAGGPDLMDALARVLQGAGGPGPAAAPAGVIWRFPALSPRSASPALPGPRVTGLASPAEVTAQAVDLHGRRAAAASRMARQFGAAASEEAHAQLREEQAAGREPGEAAAVERRRRRSAAAGQEVALAAGAALHRALELWDLAAEPSLETERQRRLLPAYLAAVAAGEELRRALPRTRELLDRFAAGGLAARLRGLAGGVLAREMPVLLAPSGETGPVGYVSGAVDLLYRDPGSGELVIADYKTDQVAGADLEHRAAAYATQGAAYARAVQQALDLPRRPRFELWFVQTGEVVSPRPPG